MAWYPTLQRSIGEGKEAVSKTFNKKVCIFLAFYLFVFLENSTVIAAKSSASNNLFALFFNKLLHMSKKNRTFACGFVG